LVLAVGLLLTGSATAQSGFFWEPWVAVSELYDDNIYFTVTDEESDFITRVSPGLLMGYESERLSLNGMASFDSEVYLQHSDLNSANARAYANLSAKYRLTRRLTLDASVDYLDTDTPVDLLLTSSGAIPGSLVGRYEAERFSAFGSAKYRIRPTLDATLRGGLIDDEIPDVSKTDLQYLNAFVDHRTSRASAMSYGYIERRFELYEDLSISDEPSDKENYHIPWLGFSHNFNERTSFAVRGGPIFGQDQVETYLVASVSRSYRHKSLSASFERDQTTLLGAPEVVNVSTVSVSYTHEFDSGLNIELTPSYVTVSLPGSASDTYTTIELRANYVISHSIYLTAGYELDRQQVSRGGRGADVNHNVLHFGITFSLPRPKARPIPQ
jgi:hypothetical protein